MKKKIDEHGVHLRGCGCKDCTTTNAVCPACGTHYWNEPNMPEYEECHKCGWTPFKQAEKLVRSTFNRLAAPFGVSI
jgi:Zn ribbon nucleic-acid-binding protein